MTRIVLTSLIILSSMNFSAFGGGFSQGYWKAIYEQKCKNGDKSACEELEKIKQAERVEEKERRHQELLNAIRNPYYN